jgi:hypothetical protein
MVQYGSMPNSQELFTCPHPEPDQSSPHHPILTNFLTPWSWALLERSLVVWTLDSFPAFHGTRRFNAEFTRALHLPLSWARPIQSTSPHPTSTRSILILTNHLRLGLPSGLLPSEFPWFSLYLTLAQNLQLKWAKFYNFSDYGRDMR